MYPRTCVQKSLESWHKEGFVTYPQGGTIPTGCVVASVPLPQNKWVVTCVGSLSWVVRITWSWWYSLRRYHWWVIVLSKYQWKSQSLWVLKDFVEVNLSADSLVLSYSGSKTQCESLAWDRGYLSLWDFGEKSLCQVVCDSPTFLPFSHCCEVQGKVSSWDIRAELQVNEVLLSVHLSDLEKSHEINPYSVLPLSSCLSSCFMGIIVIRFG